MMDLGNTGDPDDETATRQSAAEVLNNLIDNFRNGRRLSDNEVAPLRYAALTHSRLLEFVPEENRAQRDVQDLTLRLVKRNGSAREVANGLVDELGRRAKVSGREIDDLREDALRWIPEPWWHGFVQSPRRGTVAMLTLVAVLFIVALFR